MKIALKMLALALAITAPFVVLAQQPPHNPAPSH